MTPDETRECIKKCALAICRDGNYTDISMTKEDLGDGKVTFRFSLTPYKKENK